jgi:hypothetical protein
MLDDEAYEEDRYLPGRKTNEKKNFDTSVYRGTYPSRRPTDRPTYWSTVMYDSIFGCLICRPIVERIRDYDGTSTWYFALTQVCRTLRTEFRPLWIMERRITVPLSSIDDYLKIHPLSSERMCNTRLGKIRLTGNLLLFDKHVNLFSLLKMSIGHFEIEDNALISNSPEYQKNLMLAIKAGHLVGLTLHTTIANSPIHRGMESWRTGFRSFILLEISTEMGDLSGDNEVGWNKWPAELRSLLFFFMRRDRDVYYTCNSRNFQTQENQQQYRRFTYPDYMTCMR